MAWQGRRLGALRSTAETTARRAASGTPSRSPSSRSPRRDRRRRAKVPDCGRLPLNSTDPRAWIVFDVNGTLASLSTIRHGKNKGSVVLRPGVHELRRLRPAFRVALWSSMQNQNMANAVALVEGSLGLDAPLDAILHREQCPLAPPAQRMTPYDTIKPLAQFFQTTVLGGLHRVILVDDSARKSLAGEEENLLLVPAWREEPSDPTLRLLVDALLAAVETDDDGALHDTVGERAPTPPALDDVTEALARVDLGGPTPAAAAAEEAPQRPPKDLRLCTAAISATLFAAHAAEEEAQRQTKTSAVTASAVSASADPVPPPPPG